MTTMTEMTAFLYVTTKDLLITVRLKRIISHYCFMTKILFLITLT